MDLIQSIAILDYKAGAVSFQDPIYAYWLKHSYFGKPES